MFEEAVAEATTEVDGKPKTKWPLDCGCQGSHYYAKCAGHAEEERRDHGRRMGIPDLTFSAADLSTDQGRDAMLAEVRRHLQAHPAKRLVIHLRPAT